MVRARQQLANLRQTQDQLRKQQQKSKQQREALERQRRQSPTQLRQRTRQGLVQRQTQLKKIGSQQQQLTSQQQQAGQQIQELEGRVPTIEKAIVKEAAFDIVRKALETGKGIRLFNAGSDVKREVELLLKKPAIKSAFNQSVALGQLASKSGFKNTKAFLDDRIAKANVLKGSGVAPPVLTKEELSFINLSNKTSRGNVTSEERYKKPERKVN